MKRLILACLVAMMCPQAEAAPPMTGAQMATLPPLCRAKLGGASQAEMTAAELSLGANNWLHFHHYCYAVDILRNRLGSSARTPSERKSVLNSIIREYEYVLKHSEKTFWMRPQIHLETGQVYERMNEKGAAMGQYLQAINFNPDFQAAYQPMITAQRDLGDTKGALETATKGLRRFPSSKGLKKAYLSLGGKEPFPEPIIRGAVLPPDARPEDAPATPKEEREGRKTFVESESATRSTSDVQAESVETDIPDRGCRFCPPEEIQKKWRDSFGGPVNK